MLSEEILLDALGGLFGGTVHRNKTENSQELSFEKYANLSLSAGQIKENLLINYNNNNNNNSNNTTQTNNNEPYEKEKHLFIKTLTGKTLTINYHSYDTIVVLKTKIYDLEEIPIGQQRLMYLGRELENNKTVLDYNIEQDSTIFLVLRFRDGSFTEYHLPNNLLDPPYHYDFTNIRDNGKVFMRGGLQYKRPCGWKRYALKVIDKYEDTRWLGSNGKSGNDTEWVVSFHGTTIYDAEPITKDGVNPGSQNTNNIGIYCTPDISTAEKYSEVYTNPVSHKKYKIVFQNRVRPSAIIKCRSKVGSDEYWYIENGKDIRPYSICIKEIK